MAGVFGEDVIDLVDIELLEPCLVVRSAWGIKLLSTVNFSLSVSDLERRRCDEDVISSSDISVTPFRIVLTSRTVGGAGEVT